MNDLRIFKSESEITNMRRAGQASGRAFTEAMRHNFSKEKDLHSFLEYQFKVKGCDDWAFVPVVAGGQVCINNIGRLTIAGGCANSLVECS